MKIISNKLKQNIKNNKDIISKVLVALLFPVILAIVIQGFFILMKANFTIEGYNIIIALAPFLFIVFILSIGVTVFLSILIYDFIKTIFEGDLWKQRLNTKLLKLVYLH